MFVNEEVHRMRAQILNLRSAGMACATAILYFPPCGRPGSCNRRCPAGRAALQEIYDSMNRLLLSVRVALAVVFLPDPKGWDLLWGVHEHSTCTEREMAKYGLNAYLDHDEFIRAWGDLDEEMFDMLGTQFSEREWTVLTAKRAWQNGRRLGQVLHLLKYLEEQIATQFDLFDSVVYGGLLGNCDLGRWAAKQKKPVA
jgi:hypothetical protein